MLANYGFKDGTGDWYLTIDTDRCDGCAKCVPVCPAGVLEVGEDEFDPLRDEPVAKVKQSERQKIRYSCAPCEPGYGEEPAPCVAACPTGAISHLDTWKLQFGQ